jgi:hypothetical protein
MIHYSLTDISTNVALHYFYNMNIPSVRNFDPIHAASAAFIDYITPQNHAI